MGVLPMKDPFVETFANNKDIGEIWEYLGNQMNLLKANKTNMMITNSMLKNKNNKNMKKVHQNEHL